MKNEDYDDEKAVDASLARVHDELVLRMRDDRKRWTRRSRWSALGVASIVLFGGGLATGAAFVNAQSSDPAVPSGLLKIDCASGLPAEDASTAPYAARQQVVYVNTATKRLTIAPSEMISADLEDDPSAACGFEIPRIVSAMGRALPALAEKGDHCGTITVPGYPKAYFIADNMVRAGRNGTTESGPFAISMTGSAGFEYAGSVATTDCVAVSIPAPDPTDPKMVSCQGAVNVAMVYLDTRAAGSAAVCTQHGYSVWKG